MHPLFIDIQHHLTRWRVEDQRVALAAWQHNLQRMRYVAPAVAALNGLCVMGWATALLVTHRADQVTPWQLAPLVTHLLMAICFGLLTSATHRLRHAVHQRAGRSLPLLMVVLTLLFVVALAALCQEVTASMTLFLIGTLACGLLAYLPPRTSAWVFGAAYVLFFLAIGQIQAHDGQWLTSRIHALAATALAWAVSVRLWRNFTTLQWQQAQLNDAHSELQAKQKELQRLTRLDGLTGLYNRNTFTELTRLELARAQRQGSHTTIVLLDLDFFKRVNDTWGHPAGDAVLKNVAAVANNTVRSTDLVGRLGGEEFIILLPNTSLEAARKLAEKLRANMQAAAVTWEQHVIKTTVSIGLASTTAAEKRDFDHLYAHADKALYTAKSLGRNRVV